MFWLLPWIGKAALAYTAGKAAKTAYKYATTDQEKEGRELGIEIAAAIYEPVFKNFKAKQKKIKAETDKEYFDAKSQVKLLKEQCAYYERETANYKSKIETIKREHGDSPGMKPVIAALAAGGGIGGGVPRADRTDQHQPRLFGFHGGARFRFYPALRGEQSGGL